MNDFLIIFGGWSQRGLRYSKYRFFFPDYHQPPKYRTYTLKYSCIYYRRYLHFRNHLRSDRCWALVSWSHHESIRSSSRIDLSSHYPIQLKWPTCNKSNIRKHQYPRPPFKSWRFNFSERPPTNIWRFFFFPQYRTLNRSALLISQHVSSFRALATKSRFKRPSTATYYR